MVHFSTPLDSSFALLSSYAILAIIISHYLPVNKQLEKQPDLVQESICEGLNCQFKLFLADDFSYLENVTQSYGIVLDNKNEVLLVSGQGTVWTLPGGGVERGETPRETVVREVYEESAVIISKETIKPFFYQKAYIKKDGKWEFDGTQVRYLARVDKKDKFIADPDLDDMSFQKFVSISSLHKYLKWEEATTFIQKHLQEQIGN